jgi:hypothetical protein
MSAKCYNCKEKLDFTVGKDLGRGENCIGCFASLRCCKMCNFYDTSAYNECREPTADRIVEKEKANFCDHFKLSGPKKSNESEVESALDLANSLFKN